jgi:capsular exopolysaccharide synthesis family protein
MSAPLANPNSPLPSLATTYIQVPYTAYRPSRLRTAMLVPLKYRRMIGYAVGAAGVLTLLIVLIMRPQYTARVTMLVDGHGPRLEAPGAVLQIADDHLATESQLLRSRNLAAHVISELGLDDSLRPARRSGQSAGTDAATIAAYLASLEVDTRPGSHLVTLSFTDSDPAAAAQIANAHARAYTRLGLRTRGAADDQTQQFLAEKLVSLRKRIQKSEEALNAYRRRSGIVSLDDKSDEVLTRLDAINKDLAHAESDEITLGAQEQLIHSRSYDSLPAVVQSDLIQKLKQQLVAAAARRASLAAKYRRGFPALDEAVAQEADIRMQLRDEIRRVVEGIESAYIAAVNKENRLRDAIKHEKELALARRDAGVKYGILLRDVETGRQLYDNVLARMKEASFSADANAANVVLVDEAVPPRWPSSPRRLYDTFVAMLAALGLSIVLAFILEAFDGTLKNPEQVERYLGVPALAAIPNFRRPSLPSAAAPQLSAPNGNGNSSNGGATAQNYSAFVAAEAYRALRSAIILSANGEPPPKTALITSATEAEGKTMTAVNTAIAFAHLGMRVALVDADLRRPRCHKALGIENQPGLAEVLAGALELENALRESPFERLSVITAGSIPDNSADLVGSARMEQAVKWLRDNFDFVVIDSCPMMLVSDAIPIAAMVDGAVLVINGPQTPRHLAASACAQLRSVGTRVFGAVLNLVDFESPDFYYSRHSYGYRHSSYYRRPAPPPVQSN